MSGIFGWSSTQFDKLLEKATSHLLLEPDWDAILQICDCIRQGDVQPKYVVSCIKKKLYAQNPHVVLYTLQVLESCVKNCGTPIHVEIATRAFMEELQEIVKNTTNENVKTRIIELVQAWAYAFRNDPKYRAVQDMFSYLRVAGYKLPGLKESDAMFLADTAPDWAEGDCCHRCRVQFSVVQRKHHCRNCGQIFCNKCSSRAAPIPRFGIEKEVRVCESCWENLIKPSVTKSSAESSPKQTAKVPTNSGGKTDQELREEEELQLAIALSQSEAESKEQRQPSKSTSKSPIHAYSSVVEQELAEPVKKGILTSSDGELDRYLNRSYWEQRHQQQKDETQMVQPDTRTSPIPSAPVSTPMMNTAKMSEKYQNGDTDEMTDFVADLRTTIEIFVNRMKSNSSRGRPVATDTYVQSQFMNITNKHSQLLKYIQEQEDSRAYFESLQDKLNQIRDARAALDALREEHKEKLRREAEEAEHQRQIQMAQKLDIMRKKKHEYLQFQRQQAMLRMQEQEREMQLRHEQQKQQYQVNRQGGTMVHGGYPQHAYIPAVSQGYPPGMQTADGSGNMPPPIAQQPYPPAYRQPLPQGGNEMGMPQLHSAEYQQPYNMQGMSASLPQPAPFPQQQQQQPHVMPPQANIGPVITTAQNPMMVMQQQQRMMQPSMPPPHMMQPGMHVPVTNISNTQGPPGMMMHHPMNSMVAGMPPNHHMHIPQMQHPPPPMEEKESEPLIVFD